MIKVNLEEVKTWSLVADGTEVVDFWAKMNEERGPLCHHLSGMIE